MQIQQQFSQKTLSNFFDEACLERARNYVLQGKVVKISAQKGQINSQVRGSKNQIYSVKIAMADLDGSNVEGVCSCPMYFNCKHVAATLITFLNSRTATFNSELSYRTKSWLENLAKLNRPLSVDTKEYFIRYVLNLSSLYSKSTITVETLQSYRLKNGNMSKEKRFSPNTDLQQKTISLEEREIYAWLEMYSDPYFSHSNGYYGLSHDNLEPLIEKLILTQRCHWQSTCYPALRFGKAILGKLIWKVLDNGDQKIGCDLESKTCIILNTFPLWYVDTTENTIGLVNTELPLEIAVALLQSPPIAAREINWVADELNLQLAHLSEIPKPTTISRIEERAIKPRPSLRLFINKEPLSYPRYGNAQLALAELSFHYQNKRVLLSENERELNYLEGNDLIVIKRDFDRENKIVSQLCHRAPFSLRRISDYSLSIELQSSFIIGLTTEAEKLYQFSLDHVPNLIALGWDIKYEHDYPYREAEEIEDWYIDLDDRGNDWFGLELGVTLKGEKINLLPMLIKAAHEAKVHNYSNNSSGSERVLLRLPKGSVLPIDRGRLNSMLDVLMEFYAGKGSLEPDTLKISRLRASALVELQKAMAHTQLRWLGGEKLLSFAKKLENFTGIEAVAVPQSLKANLRPYQAEGLNWLQFLREYQLGGILADDMGLGKTIQVLTHLIVEKENNRLIKPSLILAPTSVVRNWESEATRFAPTLKVLVLHGNERKASFKRIKEHDIILSTYPLILRDQKQLLEHDYQYLILDEAQTIKNSKAKMTQLIQQVKADFRLCLTGTPMENHLGELWSLFNFLMPGLLGSHQEFKTRYRNPIEKFHTVEKQKQLSRVIRPFILRRTKQEVVQELPEKTEIIQHIDLDGRQRDLYESIRLAMNKKVKKTIDQKGIERSQIIILDALLKLRQVCCDPRLVKLESAQKTKESAKLAALFEILPEMINEGRRILLFSQFTSMLKLIEEELKKYSIDYIKLTGDSKNRVQLVEKFQSKKVPLFLISLKAGGTGLNLTAADTVIHYDPWWNPAVENQATDRAYRIGQDKTVFVYKFITINTVEEKILSLQAKKRAF